MATPLLVLSIAFAVLSLMFAALTVRALKKKRALGTATSTLSTLLMLSLSALFGTLSVSTQGYRALTREELAASVTTRKLAEQQFEARVEFADGRDTVFVLAGDEFYMDAHILKWTSIANIIGLHTNYELDRISGRYLELEDERSKPRTVFPLAQVKSIDLFDLRQKHAILGWLVDAEYGSGTFMAVDHEATFDVTVSTTGLLVRRRSPGAGRPDA